MKVFLSSNTQFATTTTKMRKIRFVKSAKRKLKTDLMDKKKKKSILNLQQKEKNLILKRRHQQKEGQKVK